MNIILSLLGAIALMNMLVGVICAAASAVGVMQHEATMTADAKEKIDAGATLVEEKNGKISRALMAVMRRRRLLHFLKPLL